MNRQLTLRLLGILVTGIPLAFMMNSYYQHKAAAIAADPQAWLTAQTARTNPGLLLHYIAAVCMVAGVCVVVELVARIADWLLPSAKP
jgi:hypothetical protein